VHEAWRVGGQTTCSSRLQVERRFVSRSEHFKNHGVRADGRHPSSIRIPLHFLSHLLSLFLSHHSPRRNSLSSAVVHLEDAGLP
jgi:hypothetical protein